MTQADPLSLAPTQALASKPEARPEAAIEELIIRPRTGWVAVDWHELIRSRELLYSLVWRDIKVRYKQTVLGVAWAVLQPLLTMAIFTVIFGRFARIPSDGVPYPVFVFAGLLPWTFFSGGLSGAGQSLLNQQHLLTKIYFPRLYVPTAAIGGLLVDFAISAGLYALVLAVYRFTPSWQVILLPVPVLLTLVLTLGTGCFLAALTALYRDFRYVVGFAVQILMYVSPVIYPASLLPERYRALQRLNPLTGIIGAYRSAILGTPWDLPALAVAVIVSLGMLALGLSYFRRVERRFADIT